MFTLQHVLLHPHTLLTRFFGLFRVKPYKGTRVHFVVMGNIFATDRPIQEVFDLKVSVISCGGGWFGIRVIGLG